MGVNLRSSSLNFKSYLLVKYLEETKIFYEKPQLFFKFCVFPHIHWKLEYPIVFQQLITGLQLEMLRHNVESSMQLQLEKNGEKPWCEQSDYAEWELVVILMIL